MNHSRTQSVVPAVRSSIFIALRRGGIWSLLLVWLVLGCQVLFGEVKVTRGSDSEAVCGVGEFRCNGEYLLSCVSQEIGWSLKDTCATGDLCDAKGKRCSVCKDGDFRCSGAKRQQCAPDGSGWQDVETCTAENLCSESSCKGCTTDGQLDCSVAPLLRECKDGVWITLDQCGSQSLCEATTAYATTATDWNQKCVAPGCPQAGAYRCEGAVLERCPPERDAWVTVDTCANSALCANAVASVTADPNAVATLDMCKPACPNAGAFMCNGTSLQQCRLDQTAYDLIKVCAPDTECDPAAGDCGQLCTPGHFQCNGATLRKCGSNGHWADEAKCESAALCNVSTDGGTGSCTASPCGSNQYTCVGAKLQKCKDDRTGYEDNLTCVSAELCDALSARCIEPTCPTPNAYQCFGQDLRRCAANQTKWDSVQTCPAGQYCNSGDSPGCLTSCPANPVRCNGKVMEHCSPATGWTTRATCSTPDLCNCALTDPDGAGPLTNSCLLGLYTDGCGNVVCGGVKGDFQCKGAELQKCQAGRNGWDKVATCGAANLCYPGIAPNYTSGYCLTCPTAGELACRGTATTLSVCSSDRRSWNTSQTCAIACVTSSGQDYCAACKSGASQCAAATLQTCPSDEKAWTNKTCASTALCDAPNKQCDVCTKTVCAGNVLQTCSPDGQTLQSQTCANLCDAAHAQCDSCKAGTVWCDGAKLFTCSADGQTSSSIACATSGLCDATNKVCVPPVCKIGEHRCTGAGLEVCDAQRSGWDPVQTCASSALCDATNGVCNLQKCSVGDKKCNVAQPQVCKADLTGFMDSGPVCASAALCVAQSLSCNPPVCALGESKCMGAQPVTCSSDRTAFVSNGPACASTALCNGGACTACAAGQMKCNGAQPQICKADLSGFGNNGAACASAALCSNGVCNACLAGQVKCNGAQPQICKDDLSGFTSNGAACASAALCVAGKCNACTAGQMKCNGAQPQICKDDLSGFANNGPACDSAALCAGGTCNACAVGDHKCKGNNLQVCNAAQSGFVNDMDCGVAGCDATMNVCNAAICTPGNYRCSGASSLALQQCNTSGTAWTAVQTCSAICDAPHGECDDCTAPSFQCSANVLQDCSATGHWETMQDCMTNVCNPQGSCDPPPPQ